MPNKRNGGDLLRLKVIFPSRDDRARENSGDGEDYRTNFSTARASERRRSLEHLKHECQSAERAAENVFSIAARARERHDSPPFFIVIQLSSLA